MSWGIPFFGNFNTQKAASGKGDVMTGVNKAKSHNPVKKQVAKKNNKTNAENPKAFLPVAFERIEPVPFDMEGRLGGVKQINTQAPDIYTGSNASVISDSINSVLNSSSGAKKKGLGFASVLSTAGKLVGPRTLDFIRTRVLGKLFG